MPHNLLTTRLFATSLTKSESRKVPAQIKQRNSGDPSSISLLHSTTVHPLGPPCAPQEGHQEIEHKVPSPGEPPSCPLAAPYQEIFDISAQAGIVQ